jgi:hypothetical protein
MNTFCHCEQSDVIHVPGLHGLPRFARSDGYRFKVRVRYRPGCGGARNDSLFMARSTSDGIVIARSASDVAIRVIRRCRHHAHWCPRAASQVAISPVYLPMPVSSGVKLMP